MRTRSRWLEPGSNRQLRPQSTESGWLGDTSCDRKRSRGGVVSFYPPTLTWPTLGVGEHVTCAKVRVRAPLHSSRSNLKRFELWASEVLRTERPGEHFQILIRGTSRTHTRGLGVFHITSRWRKAGFLAAPEAQH